MRVAQHVRNLVSVIGRSSPVNLFRTKPLRSRAIVLAALALSSAVAHADEFGLSGKYYVGSNGESSYSMQIAVPPGGGGLAPNLALSYSSQQGDGYMGLGWALTGLPSITRCAPTLAQDGVVGTITYTMTDKFCLDGQRLMAISGTYGADGTEYHTERDSYSRIISHGTTGNGPTWFEVHTKDGVELDFGYAPDPASAPSSNSHVVVQGRAVIPRVASPSDIEDALERLRAKLMDLKDQIRPDR